ncbi:MAG TPA: hypothetical protein VGW10_02010 [Solirubrobacteraceae bacterium]|nr:hypothetical protein [Solirubrobacteraceae bacterium]
MTDKSAPPLRGEAAWKAEKQRIADRNEAAYKRGAAQRASSEARTEERRRAAAREQDAHLPVQPHPLD